MTKKVCIVGPYKQAYVTMFASKGGFTGVKTVDEADIVVFTGGADIDPSFYNEQPLTTTVFDGDRDMSDLEAYFQSEGKLKVGICRGAQFLNCMNGGKLWQDVNNHTKSHFVHEISTSRRIWCTSTHHQAMIPDFKTATLIGYSTHATEKLGDGHQWRRTTASPGLFSTVELCGDLNAMDWEVVLYKGSSSLCFQPHPEHLNYGDCKQWFFQQLGVALATHYTKKAV